MLAQLRKLGSLLPPAQRRRWLLLGPLLFVAGLVETVATALVFGLIKLAGDPGYASRTPPFSSLVGALHLTSDASVVLAYGLFLAAFFMLRAGLLVLAARAAGRLEGDTLAALSTRLLDSYLEAPFALHLRHSPAELSHDVTAGVERVVSLGLGASVQIVAEVLVSAGLCAFLLAAAPLITLATASVLALLVGVALRVTRRSSSRYGLAREELSRRAAKGLQQSIGGVREIKVLGRERAFHDAFAGAQTTMARMYGKHVTVMSVPRLAIETIFVCCVILIVALMTLRGGRSADLVPLLAVYAYAGFRLIPAANRLLLRVDSLRNAGPAIDRIHANLALFESRRAAAEIAEEPIDFKEAIVIDGVGYRYDGGAKPVLDGVSFTVQRGQSIGIVGPSGAGKTTLVDLILGLLEPTAGRILVDGVDIARAPRGWRRRIGYVPQTAFLFDDSIARNVALGVPAAEIDRGRLDEALRMAQLAELMATLPEGADTVIGDRGVRLSGGQRQRVAIARALYHQPDLLVFDEATAALDNQTERDVTRALEELRGQKTLIVIAHRLTTVERCDALVFLRDGRVEAIGPYARLASDNAEFRAMAALVDD